MKEVLKDPERVMWFSYCNKNTRCINQEIVVTQRVHHVAWHFLRLTDSEPNHSTCQDIEDGKIFCALTDISFKIMQVLSL